MQNSKSREHKTDADLKIMVHWWTQNWEIKRLSRENHFWKSFSSKPPKICDNNHAMEAIKISLSKCMTFVVDDDLTSAEKSKKHLEWFLKSVFRDSGCLKLI